MTNKIKVNYKAKSNPPVGVTSGAQAELLLRESLSGKKMKRCVILTMIYMLMNVRCLLSINIGEFPRSGMIYQLFLFNFNKQGVIGIITLQYHVPVMARAVFLLFFNKILK